MIASSTRVAVIRGRHRGLSVGDLARAYNLTRSQVKYITGEKGQERQAAAAKAFADKEVAKLRAQARELLRSCPACYTASQWRRIVLANYGDVLEGVDCG